VLDVAIQGSGTAQHYMVAGQHHAGMGPVGQVCLPGRIVIVRLEPTDEIAHGTPDGSGAGRGVEWLEVETTSGKRSRIRLASYLDQLVVTRQ
jgi:hypothetical protein